VDEDLRFLPRRYLLLYGSTFPVRLLREPLVRDLSCPTAHAATVESAPSAIGRITLDAKQVGARSAGNLHAACDVAGVGNGVKGRIEAPADGESRR